MVEGVNETLSFHLGKKGGYIRRENCKNECTIMFFVRSCSGVL